MKKYYTIVITLIALGILLFLVQSFWCTPATFWYSVTGNIGCAILIGGMISLFEHIFLNKENEERIRNLFGISLSIKKSGLSNILTNSQDYHYHDLIISSKDFSIVINDGRRWVSNHIDALEQRFNKKGTNTELFLVDPESDFCKALDKKTFVEGLDTPDVKIGQTISLLKSTYEKSNKCGSLKIYYLKNYPTQTLFYADEKVVVTPYQTSSGRAIIPLYEYHYNPSEQSIASHLVEDLERVRNESNCIIDLNG